MRLYNTLTRRKDELQPVEPGLVKIYSCGPTVYMSAHIGNFRSFLFADFLRRGLEFCGHKVRQVMNITDVGHLTDDEDAGEDKLEKGARAEGTTPEEVARHYEAAFWRDADRLNLLRPDVTCRASAHIPEMIKLVRRIEANGFAYRTGVGLIFDTGRYADYAGLARLNLAEQQAGARVKVDPDRRNPSDFALWITNQPRHLMQWDSPWGRGFPGWHLECSAMSLKYLGERFDIHTGGIDHIPVHHTNERAQNFAATGGEAVSIWLHGAFLTIGDARMGKSEGNLITLTQLEQRGFRPEDFRYLCLTALYRTPLNFTAESMTSARNSLNGLIEFGRNAQGWPTGRGEWLDSLRQEFRAAIEDDLNLPQALAVTWTMVREGNKRQDRASWEALLDSDRVFGLGLTKLAGGMGIVHMGMTASGSSGMAPAGTPDDVFDLARQRQTAREHKNWAEADRLREEIAAHGYLVEDTPGGNWRLKPLA